MRALILKGVGYLGFIATVFAVLFFLALLITGGATIVTAYLGYERVSAAMADAAYGCFGAFIAAFGVSALSLLIVRFGAITINRPRRKR